MAWAADAGNIRDLSYVLGNVEVKDDVLRNVKTGGSVFRYLYVEETSNEGVASDGTSLQRDDNHIYLTKPLQPEELEDMVKRFLPGDKIGPPSETQ